MKQYQFIENMSPSQIDDFNLHQSNQHDINSIGQFLTAPMIKTPTDEISRHNALVETRNRIDILISAIIFYENENKENPTNHLEDN